MNIFLLGLLGCFECSSPIVRFLVFGNGANPELVSKAEQRFGESIDGVFLLSRSVVVSLPESLAGDRFSVTKLGGLSSFQRFGLGVCVWFLSMNTELKNTEDPTCNWKIIVGYYTIDSKIMASILPSLADFDMYVSCEGLNFRVFEYGSIRSVSIGSSRETDRESPVGREVYGNRKKIGFLELRIALDELQYAFHGMNSVGASPIYQGFVRHPSLSTYRVVHTRDETVCVSCRFAGFGDWGHIGPAMDTFVADLTSNLGPIDGIFLLGDNFYPVGINAALGLNDPQFAEFVKLAHCTTAPFYTLLGNHDYSGSVSAQLEFDHPQWIMPQTYYLKRFVMSGGEVCVWFLDTNCGRFNEAQIAWLTESIQTETECTWRVATGHHPVYTSGEYSDNKILKKKLLPILQAHNFVMYISGHEHSTQILKDPSYRTLYVIAGATSEIHGQPEKWQGPHEFLQYVEWNEQAWLDVSFANKKVTVNIQSGSRVLWACELTSDGVQHIMDTSVQPTEPIQNSKADLHVSDVFSHLWQLLGVEY